MAASQTKTDFILFSTAADAVTGHKLVKAIIWAGATSAAHACVLTDTAGNTIYTAHADTGLVDHFVHFDTPIRCDGIIAATLGSGTVLVYLQ